MWTQNTISSCVNIFFRESRKTMTDSKGLTMSVPLFFCQDGGIDYASLGKYITQIGKLNKVAALYSMAYNTRYRMLDFEETIEVNRFLLEKCAEHSIPAYVGHPYIVNEKSLGSYLERIADLQPLAVSMLYPERYFGLDKPILDFLNFPAKFGLSTLAHEMKLVSGFDGELIDWPESLIREAIASDNTVAIKEDSKNDAISSQVLREAKEHDVTFILAGGGKKRALKFMDEGLETWLNGTTMFLPEATDKIYTAIIEKDMSLVNFYCNNIEKPFFDKVVEPSGWHLAHKAALEYFGFGTRNERFPHAVMPEADYKRYKPVFMSIDSGLAEFMSL
jgi:dihydrodipicolinate synthase/N-acetylneuraminate lyase